MAEEPKSSHVLEEAGNAKKCDIIAAQKIIADISSGVYRSPAAALKELISNAYDADAKEVTITTDAPRFRTLVIKDDGVGMSIEKFLDVVTHIGGSTKRMEGDSSVGLHRPLIGRIGIGLLAVAQLGNRFYVSSKVKNSTTRFIAEVNLEPFHRDDAALKSMGAVQKGGKIHIGGVQYVDNIPEDFEAQYTVITVPDAKKGLISEMTSTVRKAVGAEEDLTVEGPKPKSFREVVEIVRNAKRTDLVLDGYYYMLWELGLLSPVNYLPDGPFETGHRQIAGVGSLELPTIKSFKVKVDGLELCRPQLFPNPAAFDYFSPDPKLYVLDYDKSVAGRKLKFTGYIYSQQPRIYPEECKGLHIRIRHVGIGMYDKSWLGYPFEEGLKFGQITGEVFVHDGLEPALNIDRDSFRETDVHYQALRAHIWDFLRRTVFPDFKARAKVFRQQHRAETALGFHARFEDAMSRLSAPHVQEVGFRRVKAPLLSDWIGVEGRKLVLQPEKWEEFLARTELIGDAKVRFLRVLQVLLTTEALTDLPRDEAEAMLEALSLAVQG
jgi:hypothetical protein